MRRSKQVYDSPPDISGVPIGLASHLFPEPRITTLLHTSVRKTLSGYCINEKLFRCRYRASSEAFHNNILEVPSLWFYSKSDSIANYRDCETSLRNGRIKAYT